MESGSAESVTVTRRPQVQPPRLLGSSRLGVTLMCLASSFLAIFATINLSIAVVCMGDADAESDCTPGVNATSPPETSATCGQTDDATGPQWDKSMKGILLGATYYGVASASMIAGWLCDKLGRTRLFMMTGVGVLTAGSFATPTVMFWGVPYYFSLRVLMGVSFSLSVSTIMPLVTSWITPREQGLIVGLAYAGINLANAATYPITAAVCSSFGWRSIFYLAGTFGLIWLPVAFFVLHDTPEAHPRISVEEKQYLLTNVTRKVKKGRVRIPWLKIATSGPVWAVVVTNFLFFAASKGISVNLPIYVQDLLDFTITENGIFSSLPAVCSLVVRLSTGAVYDCVRANTRLSVTTVRKLFHLVGTLIPAALLFVVSCMDAINKYTIITLISVCYALTELTNTAGFQTALIDIAPRFVGVLAGINVSIGLLPGIVMPLVVAALTPHGSQTEWSHVFQLFGGLFTAACLLFAILGSADVQTWNDDQARPSQGETRADTKI